MRLPKNLFGYVSSEDAATGLENIARMIREHHRGEKVCWTLSLNFWSNDWRVATQQRFVARKVRYESKNPRAAARKN